MYMLMKTLPPLPLIILPRLIVFYRMIKFMLGGTKRSRLTRAKHVTKEERRGV